MISKVKNSLHIRLYSLYVMKRRCWVERWLESIVKRDRYHIRFRFHAPGVGLFAHLNWALWISACLERTKTSFEFSATSSNYSDDGADWFGKLFDQPHTGGTERPVKEVTIHGWEDTPFHRQPDIVRSFGEAHRIQSKYFPVRGEISDFVDGLIDQKFDGSPFISCHYRGTDKSSEALRMEYSKVIDFVEEVSGKLAEKNLFVASDEHSFVKTALSRFGEQYVLSMDCERSEDGDKIHNRSAGQNLRRAREALIDCLLLSRGTVLLKTASMLSGWAKVFNPELDAQLLSRPFDDVDWFPDRLIPSYVSEG